MVQIRIPEKRRPSLHVLARATREAVDELFGLLAGLPFRLNIHDSVEEAVKKSINFSPDDASQIVTSLMMLFRSIGPFDGTIEEFIGQVIKSMQDSSKESDQLTSDECIALAQNLSKLLRVPSLSTSARAAALIVENSHTFSTATVNTDVRSLFDLDRSESIVAAVIIHHVNVNYFEGSEHRSFSFAMDESDLDTLLRKLQKSKSEASVLRKQLISTNVNVPDYEEK